MFEVVIELEVSTIPVDENLKEGDYRTQEIARYKFDPGLQVGDRVVVTDLKLGNRKEEPFNFAALVKERIIEVIPGNKSKEDCFRISIVIEAVEKETIAKIADIMKNLNPGTFKE